MNIVEILHVQTATNPHAEAIVDVHHRRRRALSFAQLETASAQAAALLQQAGLETGDAVLVFQPMSQELYVALLAIFRLGLVAMFLDPAAGKDHIERCCLLYPPRALIATSKAHLLRLISPALRRVRHCYSIGWRVPGAISWDRVRQMVPLPEVTSVARTTPALLTFTSGSTGQPKAAMRTHGFLLAQHRALQQSLHLEPGTVDLTTLPIFVLSNLATGVTSLIPDADLRRPGAIDPAPVAQQIAREHPFSVGASPAFLERLADGYAGANRVADSFGKIFTGGAPVFPHVLRKLKGMAPQAEIVAVYGSTEAEPIAEIEYGAIAGPDLERMHNGGGLLCGPPVPALELRILPDQWGQRIGPYTQAGFKAAELPRGAVGEIAVSGEHVLPGYWHGHGDEETKFEVAGCVWHRTGDAGRLDEQGRLWLLGRCAARIEDRWGVLYPFAVEVAANDHPGVHRAAVITVGGERLLAVELDLSHRLEVAPLRHSLAWAHISRVQILHQIPTDKRHNAKIDYPALRTLVGGFDASRPG